MELVWVPSSQSTPLECCLRTPDCESEYHIIVTNVKKNISSKAKWRDFAQLFIVRVARSFKRKRIKKQFLWGWFGGSRSENSHYFYQLAVKTIRPETLPFRN